MNFEVIETEISDAFDPFPRLKRRRIFQLFRVITKVVVGEDY